MPKIVDYERKKKEIVDRAKEVFAIRGYQKTNLADISEKCGMGRTTLYQYFKNKDEIFYHTVGDTLEEIKTQVEVIIEDDNLTSMEKLKKLVFELTSESEHSYIFVLLVEVWIILERENNELLETINMYTKELKHMINELIVNGIETKEFRPVNSAIMADTIFTFIQTFTLQISSHHNNADVHENISSMNVLMEGLKA